MVEFGKDIEDILECIRKNCVILNKVHKKEYLQLKESLKYYRIPIIIISSLNSIISVSQQFIPQRIITACNSTLALFCGIIGSIELFLGINAKMEIELNSSKDYYILSCDIYKFLCLNTVNRPDGKTFLEESYGRYIKLYESSCLLNKKLEDSLTVFSPNINIPRNDSNSISDETILSITPLLNSQIEQNSPISSDSDNSKSEEV
jgi:hypothetical protein